MIASRVSVLAIAAVVPLAPICGQWQIPPRGVVEFDRRVEEFAVRAPTEQKGILRVVKSGPNGGHDWRVLMDQSSSPPTGWLDAGFDDSKWTVERSGFGSSADSDPNLRTTWETRHARLRTRFEIPRRRRVRAALLTVRHDDAVAVWINGIEVARLEGAIGYYRHMALPEVAVRALRSGKNVLAVHCQNARGASAIDVGLTLCESPFVDDDDRKNREDGEWHAHRLRGNLFPECMTPPLVFDGELDPSKRFIRLPPRDLRAIGFRLATDWRAAIGSRSIKTTYSRLDHFGDLRIKAKGTKLVDGVQEITARVESVAPASNGDPKLFVKRFVTSRFTHEFDGQVTVKRTLDLAAGLVRAFEFELTGTFGERAPGAPRFDLVVREKWTLRSVRKNRDAKFRADVVQAIQDGAAWIRSAIRGADGGPIKAEEPGSDRTYRTGRLAIGLLALAHAGFGEEEEVVKDGFDELRKRELVDTYSLANALMAMEKLYSPAGERDDLLSGLIDKPRTRVLPPADLECMKRWMARLLDNQDPSIDAMARTRFSYTGKQTFDNSVNQYGLLGMYAGQLCGIEVETERWQAAIDHLLDTHTKLGAKVKLRLTDAKEWERIQKGDEVTGARLAPVPAAGWHYHWAQSGGSVHPAYGSMTAAGIAGLALATSVLRTRGLVRDRRHATSEDAIRHGFAWLAENFSARWHPGRLDYQLSHLHYYLYTLERACELTGVVLFQGRDWYFEGAMALMSWQKENGSFMADVHRGEPLERTAMAVLFLKKSALPVQTVK